jgi:H+/Cl- antiporter ClcA
MKPNNWLWQSIVATILCCIVFGIVGIVYAAKVDSLYYKGQYYEAERVAKKAKMWTLIAVVVGLVYIAVTVSWYLTGNFPEQLQEIIENSASGYNF